MIREVLDSDSIIMKKPLRLTVFQEWSMSTKTALQNLFLTQLLLARPLNQLVAYLMYRWLQPLLLQRLLPLQQHHNRALARVG